MLVSKKKLKTFKNISYINQEIKDLNKKKYQFDFAYSLGVIHHLEYPNYAFRVVSSKLKKGSPFLVYLYHNFEENNELYKLIWKLSEQFRSFISNQNLELN